MAKFRVLSKEVLAGFDKYKYSCLDTSPLAKYVMHPFWNWFVQFYPMWVAPNLLTLSGFLLLIVNFAMMVYYDLDFYASSDDHPEWPPVPRWVWLICAFDMFFAHTLDGTDGKQARRTKSSSPLGELFDHGLDSYATLFMPVCAYSVIGRGEFGVDVYRAFYIFLSINFCFIASHVEKYNTGILYLPWFYDFSQVMITAAFLLTFICGYEVWKIKVFGYFAIEIAEIAVYFALAGLSLPVSIWNIYVGYRDKTGKMLSFTEAVRPLTATVLLTVLMLTWAFYSSYDIINEHPRVFYWTTGTVFSNIACHLIIAQMSSTRCELINWLLVPLFTIVSTVCFLDLGVLEFYILCGYAAFVTVSHLHFGYSVVMEMCEHFKINALTIKTWRK